MTDKKKKRSVVEKVILERGARLQFLELEDENGEPHFMFLLIRESEYELFMKKLEKGIIEPEVHGLALLKGKGKLDPEKVAPTLREILKMEVRE